MEYSAKNKYISMMRAYTKLQKIYTDNGNTISFSDPDDEVDSFFTHCYHLKDWLKKDASMMLTDKVEAYISSSIPLSIAADYCNASKHGGLDRPPKSGMMIEKKNHHLKMDLTSKGFVTSARMELTIDGKKYDAFALATDCLRDWNKFLKTNGINFNE